MVKLKGPGLALSAGGSLADQLTFSSSKGTAYLKRKSKPSQPHTKPQVALRAAMKFLSQQWAIMPNSAKDTWPPLAVPTNISAYNAFIAYNIDRARNHRGFSRTYPATETGSFANPTTWSITGHIRRIRHTFDITNLNQNWTVSFCHVTASGIQPTWKDVVQILYTPFNGTYVLDWYPVPAGTYWFSQIRSTNTGKFLWWAGWRSGTVTD